MARSVHGSEFKREVDFDKRAQEGEMMQSSMETAAENARSASAVSGDVGSDAAGGLSASEARPPGAGLSPDAAASSNTGANTDTQSRDGSSTRTAGERRVRRPRAAAGAVSRPPERSGWVELREEKERLALIERKSKGRMDWRWLILKDCRLRVYKNEEEARIEPETAHIISCDLRGSVCCHDAVLDRTLSLETGALTSSTLQRRVLTIRADTEEATTAWIIALSQSSMWESVLRAAAQAGSMPRRRKVVRKKKTGHDPEGGDGPTAAEKARYGSSGVQASAILGRRDGNAVGSGSDLDDGEAQPVIVPESSGGFTTLPQDHDRDNHDVASLDEQQAHRRRAAAAVPAAGSSASVNHEIEEESMPPSRPDSGGSSEGGGSHDGESGSSSEWESEEERLEQERQNLFREAFCQRPSDSEDSDDIADLDSKLETRDDIDVRAGKIRRVRRVARRRALQVGQVFSWGIGHNYCLGHGSYSDERFPKAIKALKSKAITQIAVGGEYTCALSSSGEVFSWGSGSYGVLGQGDVSDLTAPRVVPFTKSAKGDEGASMIACGARHSMMVTKGGEVFCWGHGGEGELGQGNRHDSWDPLPVFKVLQGITVVAVACGGDFSVVLTATGRIMSWGCGANGRLGLGDAEGRLSPAEVDGVKGSAVTVACGKAHAIVATESGEVWGWGAGPQNGSGQCSDVHVPLMVGGGLLEKGGEIAISVACGQKHSVALTIRGRVWCWGRGEGYALGNISLQDELLPRVVGGIVKKAVILHISCGGTRTAALARGGTLMMWGGVLAISEKSVKATTHAFNRIKLPDGGGVYTSKEESTLGLLRKEAKEKQKTVHESMPNDLLAAALEAGLSPGVLNSMRHQLILGSSEALSLLPSSLSSVSSQVEKLVDSLGGLDARNPPVSHPRSTGEALVRVQLAIESAAKSHAAVKDYLSRPVQTAELVIKQILRDAGEAAVARATGVRVPRADVPAPIRAPPAPAHVPAAAPASSSRTDDVGSKGKDSAQGGGRARVQDVASAASFGGMQPLGDWGGETHGGWQGDLGMWSGGMGGQDDRKKEELPVGAEPQSLDYLKDEVVNVALGEGCSFVICNKVDALRGHLPRVGIYVKAAIRSKGRKEEEKARKEAKSHRSGKKSKRNDAGRAAVSATSSIRSEGAPQLPRGSINDGGIGSKEETGAEAAHEAGSGVVEAGHVVEGETSNKQKQQQPGETVPSNEDRDARAHGRIGASDSTASSSSAPYGGNVDDIVGDVAEVPFGAAAGRGGQATEFATRKGTAGLVEERSSGSGVTTTSRNASGQGLETRQAPRKTADVCGWLLIHEVVAGLDIGRSVLSLVGKASTAVMKMKWERRWGILLGNTLSVYEGPEDVMPLYSTILDGYQAVLCSKKKYWSNHLGERVPKDVADIGVPTFELCSTGLGGNRTDGHYDKHLYCRAPGGLSECKRWVAACQRAAVMSMVRSNMEERRGGRGGDAGAQGGADDWRVPEPGEAWSVLGVNGEAVKTTDVLPSRLSAQLEEMSSELKSSQRMCVDLRAQLLVKEAEWAEKEMEWAHEKRRMGDAAILLTHELHKRDSQLKLSLASSRAAEEGGRHGSVYQPLPSSVEQGVDGGDAAQGGDSVGGERLQYIAGRGDAARGGKYPALAASASIGAGVSYDEARQSSASGVEGTAAGEVSGSKTRKVGLQVVHKTQDKRAV